MEYLNQMPVIQLIADFTEADDIIAHAINSNQYNGWRKTIHSETSALLAERFSIDENASLV